MPSSKKSSMVLLGALMGHQVGIKLGIHASLDKRYMRTKFQLMFPFKNIGTFKVLTLVVKGQV